MRTFARLTLVALTLVLAAGPGLSAAALVTHEQPTLTTSDSSSVLARLGALVLTGLGALGAIRVKDAGSIAGKWKRNASAAQNDYAEGVKAAGADWEQGARDGNENYKQAVVQAASEDRFARGVAKAGAAKYVSRASTLGPQRFQTGVGAAEAGFSSAIQPVLQTIASVALPPRRPKGDPGNMARSEAVAMALRRMKVGR